jgi:hypothetical protein
MYMVIHTSIWFYSFQLVYLPCGYWKYASQSSISYLETQQDQTGVEDQILSKNTWFLNQHKIYTACGIHIKIFSMMMVNYVYKILLCNLVFLWQWL